MKELLKPVGIVVAIILLLSLFELFKKNAKLSEAKQEQEQRIEALNNYIDSLDTVVRLSEIRQEDIQAIKEGHQQGLEIHTQTKIKYVTKTIPNYIDIIDMSSVDKRDSIATVIRRTEPISNRFFELLDSSLTKQRHYEIPLRP